MILEAFVLVLDTASSRQMLSGGELRCCRSVVASRSAGGGMKDEAESTSSEDRCCIELHAEGACLEGSWSGLAVVEELNACMWHHEVDTEHVSQAQMHFSIGYGCVSLLV